AASHSIFELPPASRGWRPTRFLGARATEMAPVGTLAAVLGLGGWQLATVGTNIGQWDLLFVSGCLTVIAGLWLARGQCGRFPLTLERLANRGALEAAGRRMSPSDSAPVQAEFDARGERWAARGALLLAGVLAASFLSVNVMRSGSVSLTQLVG